MRCAYVQQCSSRPCLPGKQLLQVGTTDGSTAPAAHKDSIQIKVALRRLLAHFKEVCLPQVWRNNCHCLSAVQAKLIVRLLRSQMLIKGHSFLEVLPAAQDKFNRELQQRLQRTVWLVPGCKSWYLSGFKAAPENPASGTTSSAAGSGGSAVMWPGLCAEFWWRTRRPIEQDWRVGSHAQVSAAGAVSSAHCSSNGGPEVATKETAQHKLMPIATVFVTDEPGEHCSE